MTHQGGPTPSRRRLRLAVPIVAAMLFALLAPAIAYAVHDLQFQLDGDVRASTTTSVGGTTQTLDWDSFFDSSGNPVAGSLTGGFTNSGFDRDFATNGDGSFNTADQTTFSTGSKDTLNITPGWQCNFDNNVNSKIDIMNAYALAYTNPANNHQILYFGLERNANTGDGNVAFWFLQDNAGCVSAGPSVAFTGNHVDGDLLVVSAFTNGGGVSTIDVYRWDGGASGALNTTPAAHGVDCKSTAGLDAVCATTNSGPLPINTSITTPWPTSNKQDGPGNTLRTSEFFEGGVDLTAKNLGGRCFNVFIADTRSSQSLTATLFDFARGRLGECTVSLTTTPSSTANRTLGSTTPITDTADIVGSTSGGGGTAPTPTGTVTFYLCSPSQLTNGICAGSSGTQIGSPVTTSEKVPGTATATSADAQSLLTVLGKYCFRAHFDAASNDPNYPGQTAETSNPAAECFTVTSVASIATAQKWLPQDTATVTASGGATVAGSVTFSLYETADCSGTAVQTFGPIAVDANGQATTSNTTYYATTKTISWRATFTSTNDVGSGSPSHCETMSVNTLNNDTGS